MAKNNKRYDDIFSEEDKEQIRQDYLNGMSIRELMSKYRMGGDSWLRKVLRGITRTYSEANRLTNKKHPGIHKHTDESKAKLRAKRIEYLKANPDATAWRKRNEPSYPEKCFIKYLEERGYDKQFRIEREKSFFPYYADFAFLDIHLVVEIDGSQHIADPKRAESDKKKDALLHELGWKVIRYTEDTVKNRWDLIDQTLLLYEYERIEEHSVVGIYRIPGKKYKKVERDENGHSLLQRETYMKNRRCKWPDKELLLNLTKECSFNKIGRMYGVTDATVKRWCKHYGIPHLRREISSIASKIDDKAPVV